MKVLYFLSHSLPVRDFLLKVRKRIYKVPVTGGECSVVRILQRGEGGA